MSSGEWLSERVGLELPPALWLVELGVFLNYFGWGAVLPFEIIYFHQARGFTVGVAGLVVGTVTGLAALGAPLAGPLIDRVGARAVAVGSLVALGVGFAGLAFADTPPKAFAAALLAGLGNGGLQPGQSTLTASMVGSELRHRASAVSRVAANMGLGLGGVIGGLIASRGLDGFVVLFLLNASTYLLYAAILAFGIRDGARQAPVAGGYRVVLCDRPFVRLALINLGVIAVGWGVFSWVVPLYATAEIGVSTRVVGFMVFANALTVVIAQIPLAKLSEGRRRLATMALGVATFVAAASIVLAAGLFDVRIAAAALVVSAVLVAIGECLYTTILAPLVADLAPPGLRGRYMAIISLSWWLGLALAPTLASQLLGVWPPAAMWACVVIAAIVVDAIFRLERHVPQEFRRTPLARAATTRDSTEISNRPAVRGAADVAKNWDST